MIVHLGDHDPSGIDMTRDITDRLEMFTQQDWLNDQMDATGSPVFGRDIIKHMVDYLDAGDLGIDQREHLGRDPITVNRIALNMAQVEEYQPPPNPAKLTDSRAEDYIANYGYDSWELDALDPATLDALIDDAIVTELDRDRYNAQVAAENDHRDVLLEASRRWGEVVHFLASPETEN